MPAAYWSALIPAILALLGALTALVRLELHQRQHNSSQQQPRGVPDTHDQSCSHRSP